jgi:acetyl esterase/lipase
MAAYYTAGADPRDPLISPLFANLANLPPMLVHVGSLETMHDESVAFAQACESAGGKIELKVWEGLIHGWHANPELPETMAALEEIAGFCQRAFDAQS